MPLLPRVKWHPKPNAAIRLSRATQGPAAGFGKHGRRRRPWAVGFPRPPHAIVNVRERDVMRQLFTTCVRLLASAWAGVTLTGVSPKAGRAPTAEGHPTTGQRLWAEGTTTFPLFRPTCLGAFSLEPPRTDPGSRGIFVRASGKAAAPAKTISAVIRDPEHSAIRGFCREVSGITGWQRMRRFLRPPGGTDTVVPHRRFHRQNEEGLLC